MPAEMFFMFTIWWICFEEAGNAGRNAALYINNNGEDKIPEEMKITLSPQNGVRYTVPSEIRTGHEGGEQLVQALCGKCI